MLAIVEQQQHATLAQIAGDRLRDRSISLRSDIEKAGNRLFQEFRLCQWCQLDKPNTVGKARLDIGAQLQRKAGLSDAAWSDQRHGAMQRKSAARCARSDLRPMSKSNACGRLPRVAPPSDP